MQKHGFIRNTVYGIVDGEPAGDDRGSLAAQERVDVDVNLPDGVIGTVGVVVQHCDLQRLVLQVLIVNLAARNVEFNLWGNCVIHLRELPSCTSNLNHSEFH